MIFNNLGTLFHKMKNFISKSGVSYCKKIDHQEMNNKKIISEKKETWSAVLIEESQSDGFQDDQDH